MKAPPNALVKSTPGSQACGTAGNAAANVTFSGVEKLDTLLAFYLPASG